MSFITYKSFPILSTPKSSKINKKSKKLHLNIELVKIKICNVEVKNLLTLFLLVWHGEIFFQD